MGANNTKVFQGLKLQGNNKEWWKYLRKRSDLQEIGFPREWGSWKGDGVTPISRNFISIHPDSAQHWKCVFFGESRSPEKITTLLSLSWGSIRDSILLSETKCMICITHLGFGFQKRSIRFKHILCNTYTVSKEENTFCWLNTILRKIWKAPVDKSIDHVPYCFAGACKVHCEREHQQATMVGNYGKLFVPLRHDDKVPFIIWTQIQGFPFN